MLRDCGPRLRAFVTRRVRCPQDADDVLSQVMLVAWRRFEDIPHGREFNWLCSTAVFVTRSMRRAHARREKLLRRLRQELPSRPATGADPADLLAECSELRTAFADLSESDRRVLLLASGGLDTRGLARALGVSPTAARQRLARARGRLHGNGGRS